MGTGAANSTRWAVIGKQYVELLRFRKGRQRWIGTVSNAATEGAINDTRYARIL